MSYASTKPTRPFPVAVVMVALVRMLWACMWLPVTFCMNQLGRRTAHSSNMAAIAWCTAPVPGPPEGMAELLNRTALRTPASRACSRNGTMTA